MVRWHYGFYPTTLLEQAIGLTVLVFAIEAWRGRDHVDWRTQLTIPALLLIAAAAISVVMAPSRIAALGLFKAYFIEPIAFALVLLNVVTTARRALLILAGFGVAGVIVGVPNAVVVLEALRAHTYDVVQTPPVVIYTAANAEALFLGPLIAIAASILLHASGRNLRLASTAFLLIAGPSMLLTFSRGGYLAMAAVAVGLALSHPRRVWLLAGTVAVGIVLAFIPPIFSRITIEFQNVRGTTLFGRAGRLELWSATLQMLQHYPVFGAGLSGFAVRIGPYWNATHPSPLERFIDPHNIVLNFWVETGLLGLAAAAWLLVVGFKLSWRAWMTLDAGWRPIQLGILLAIVAVVVHGLVDVPYFKNDLSLEFWTLLGLVAAAQPRLERHLR